MEEKLGSYNQKNILSVFKGLIKVMRPKQWTKNLILFAGIIFSGNLFNQEMLLLSLLGFGLFCIFSGSVYIINDIADVEKDRNHPKKCKRPIASRQISEKQGITFLIFILSSALYIGFSVSRAFTLVGLAYFTMNILYSFKLKNVVILDVMTIALGFVLRAVAGVLLIGVRISPWLLLCTILLSLFLALNKRKSEIKLLEIGAKSHRPILEEYTHELIDSMLSIVTASTVMAYSLYTFSVQDSPYFMGTTLFVIYGIFRYLYISYKTDLGGSPELVLLKDKPMIINVLLWTISCIYILYYL